MSSKAHFSQAPSTVTASPGGAPEWEAALSNLEQRHTQAMAALEQVHGDRLAQLEERLSTAERLASDLSGQIQELR